MRIAASIAVVLLLLAAALGVYASRPEIAAVAAPPPDSFAADLVARGQALAAIGNCSACHTANGAFLAGGRAIPTPFGTLYSTNITPDADTGIGRWSEEAFRRAMHEGVDREGRHLYPAFPYDHFTLVIDADNRALYAYLMTRVPIRAEARRNRLWFPMNLRMTVAVWKRLFFEPASYVADSRQSAEWNRGAYLVEGLAHCGACHTPRNALGAERRDRAFGGGDAEGWNAYALDAASPAPVHWDERSLALFLRNGWHPEHGVARGPMAPVSASLNVAPEEDVQAMAAYLAWRMGGARGATLSAYAPLARGSAAREPTAPDQFRVTTDAAASPASAGAAIYTAACAGCHDGARPLPFGGIDLARSTAVNAPSPRNLINVTLRGLPAADGHASAIMPGLDGAIGDDQLAALLKHLRATFSAQPPWMNLRAEIDAAREAAGS